MEYLYTNHLQSILSCAEKSAYGIASNDEIKNANKMIGSIIKYISNVN